MTTLEFRPIKKEVVIEVEKLLQNYEISASEGEISELANIAMNFNEQDFNDKLDEIVKRTEVKVIYYTNLKTNMVFGEIITNRKLDTNDYNFELMEERGNILIPVTKTCDMVKIDNPYPTYIGSSLWTCDCETDFIHTLFKVRCPKCGASVLKPTYRGKAIWALFM